METKFGRYIIFLMLGKVSSHLVYLIVVVISLEIYPIMIRTKGTGVNLALSSLGAIASIFMVENLEYDSMILYLLLFNFFMLVMCYGLPNRIGTLILDNPKNLKEEDEDDVKLGDICVENAIFVKSKKKDKPKEKQEEEKKDEKNDEKKN